MRFYRTETFVRRFPVEELRTRSYAPGMGKHNCVYEDLA